MNQGLTKHFDEIILPAKRHKSGAIRKREKEARLLVACVELMLRYLGDINKHFHSIKVVETF